MKEKKTKTMHEMIMEEVNSNPILTEEELRDMIYFPTEEEIRSEEELTEAIFNRVERIEESIGHILSDAEFNKIVTEEKRKMLFVRGR